MLVLALYFEQDNQRVCRCDYCWGYFIPKTKKVTRYCDWVTDGQSCKQRGANLARLDKTSEDDALLVCNKPRDRMYSRLFRWQDAAPSERSNLMPMDYEQYDQWSENARLAREEYVQGELTAEEFLRKIDTTHELASYEADKIVLPDEPSIWQRLIERDFRFDPERYFPKEKAHLILGVHDPQWQILTADDQRRAAQKGHQSLKGEIREMKTTRGQFGITDHEWLDFVGSKKLKLLERFKEFLKSILEVNSFLVSQFFDPIVDINVCALKNQIKLLFFSTGYMFIVFGMRIITATTHRRILDVPIFAMLTSP